MNKKIFLLFSIICLLTMFVDILISEQFTANFFHSLITRRRELHKVYQYESYLSRLKDAQTGQRGFVITGNPKYLEPYYDSLFQLNSPKFKDFISEELEDSDADLVEKVKRLEKIKQDTLRELAKVIEVRKQEGFESAKEIVETGLGKKMMGEMRYLTQSIIQKKQDHLDVLDQQIQQQMDHTTLLLVLTDVIAATLVGLCLYYVYRAIKKLEKKDKELSLALQKLQENAAFREALLTAANSAIISVDQKGVITSFNSAAESMLGYRKEELIGKLTPMIFHDPQEVEARAIALSKQMNRKILPGFDVFTLFAKEGIPDTHDWTYVRKDGSRFPIQLSITAIKDAKEAIMGYMGIAYDITERKEIDNMKNELIALASYELRSPVVAIKGALDLLSLPEFGLSEQAKKVLSLSQKNCNRLVHLTEDILDVQRIEAGKAQFNFKKVYVSEFLSQVFLSQNLMAQQSHVILECPFPPSQWAIEADEDRLVQVMDHLVSNAIKYSPPNGIVKIAARKVDSKIRFEIEDQGPGIPEDFQSKIFQKFARDKSLANAGKTGVGLGLTIAKSIIEKHGGVIGFQTNSKGTTFWFELPASE